MTTGSKLSLLVVLAFVIVMGMFLTSYWDNARRVPQAPLLNTMQNVLDSASTPGTRRTLPGPVVLNEVHHDRPLPTGGAANPPPRAVVTVPPGTGTRVIEVRDERREEAAAASAGVSTAGSAPQGAAPGGSDSRARNEAATSGGTLQVVAKPGDTVSKWAAQHLGANTKANRDAIIRANPSLTANPNCVVVGQTYVIPAPSGGRAQTAPEAVPPAQDRSEPAAAPYTVRPGDTLWRIAVTQCGSGSAVARIRELNREVIGSNDVLKPGTVLKLPPRSSNG